MVIKTNKELRDHLGGAINMSLTSAAGEEENNQILAYVDVAVRKYVRRAIGDQMLALLSDQYNSTEGVSLENKEIFHLVQKACAFYAYGEYSAYSAASDGDGGLVAAEKTNPKMWQVLERMEKSFEIAGGVIEEVIRLLFEGDFPVFKSSEIFQSTYGLLVNCGSVLHRALPVSGGSYRMFLTLWPYINDVEELECSKVMGEQTYRQLLQVRKGTEQPSAHQQKALALAQKLSAHAAFLDALSEVFIVESDGGSLRVKSEFDGIRNKNTPNVKQLHELKASIDSKVNRYRGELNAFLDANRSAFPLYDAQFPLRNSRFGFLDNDKFNTIFSI